MSLPRQSPSVYNKLLSGLANTISYGIGYPEHKLGGKKEEKCEGVLVSQVESKKKTKIQKYQYS